MSLFLVCPASAARKKVVPAAGTLARPPQFVCLSFDGFGHVMYWKRFRRFSRRFEKKHKGKRLKFTLFTTAVNFVPTRHRRKYRTYEYLPRKKRKGTRRILHRGRSFFRFGGSHKRIAPRLEQMLKAQKEGHEIGSHTVSHYNAYSWSAFQWREEFSQYNQILYPLFKQRKVPEKFTLYKGRETLAQFGIVGFRAPFLGINRHLWPVMHKYGFRYDASRYGSPYRWPKKKKGIWRFNLGLIPVAGTKHRRIAMDWNFFRLQANLKPAPARERRKHALQMQASYRGYFLRNYYGNRAPLHIGHHLAKMNGHTYWKAIERFASEVCHLPEVRCVTYTTLANFLDKLSPATLKAYQKRKFDRTRRPRIRFRKLHF